MRRFWECPNCGQEIDLRTTNHADVCPGRRNYPAMPSPYPTPSPPPKGEGARESQEKRARRLFDEMARNIGREAVNHLKTMYPHMLSEKASESKIWETSLVNHVRNDINWRMRPLLMAMIAMHREWEEETVAGEDEGLSRYVAAQAKVTSTDRVSTETERSE